MIHRFKSSDCPNADGRQPLPGEQRWTFSVPLEGGMDYLEITIGKKGREALRGILEQEEKDDREEP